MAARRARLILGLICLLFQLGLAARPAVAGPPYVSDDPEPTDLGHFEIYGFTSGTVTRDGTTGQAGIDFNYGALPDLQVTIVVPSAFAAPADGALQVGLGNVQFAAKYRFLHQDSFGLDVSFFPRLFMPAGTPSVGSSNPSVLLPLWLQKDWGKWSLFGGGGCAISYDPGQDFCLAGAVVTRQVLPDLRLGIEVQWQSGNAEGALDSTGVGLGATYDLSEHVHLLAYVNRGVENSAATDEISWYASVLLTF